MSYLNAIDVVPLRLRYSTLQGHRRWGLTYSRYSTLQGHRTRGLDGALREYGPTTQIGVSVRTLVLLKQENSAPGGVGCTTQIGVGICTFVLVKKEN